MCNISLLIFFLNPLPEIEIVELFSSLVREAENRKWNVCVIGRVIHFCFTKSFRLHIDCILMIPIRADAFTQGAGGTGNRCWALCHSPPGTPSHTSTRAVFWFSSFSFKQTLTCSRFSTSCWFQTILREVWQSTGPPGWCYLCFELMNFNSLLKGLLLHPVFFVSCTLMNLLFDALTLVCC